MGKRTKAEDGGFALLPQEGRGVWHMGALWTFKVDHEQTNGLFCLAEQLLPRGFAPPVHRHSREDEAWIVLDGEVTFFLDDRRIATTAGAYVYGPRNHAHTFLVESETARLATFIAPGGAQRFFVETGEAPASLVLPPPPDAPPDMARLVAKMEEYGVELLAPPPHLEERVVSR